MTTHNPTERAIASDDPAWIVEHPEVVEASPRWANFITLADDVDGKVSIGYDLRLAGVEIGVAATWKDGNVTASNEPPTAYFPYDEQSTSSRELYRIAADIVTAARALNEAAA